MKKRSVKIQGHSTSISLEEEFWTAFRMIAKERKQSASSILAELDRKRGRQNLSSAIRVFVLRYFQDKVTPPEHPE